MEQSEPGHDRTEAEQGTRNLMNMALLAMVGGVIVFILFGLFEAVRLWINA